MTKMSCCISFQFSWCWGCNGVFFMPVASCKPTPVPVASHDQKSHVAPHSDHLELTNAVVPLTLPSASHDTNATIKFILWGKSHVTPLFDYLGLTNAVVSLMMLFASHDVDAGGNGIMWQKSCCIFFWSSWPNKWNGALMTQLALCDSDSSNHGITWPEMLHCPLFPLPWPNEYNGAIDTAIGITWCWFQCNSVGDSKIMIHLILSS